MATNEEAVELRDEYAAWYKDYGITDYLDNTPENWEKVQQMDTHLVWTDHGTCEDPQVTSGARMYNGHCCWDTYGWHIGTIPWEDGFTGPDDTYISFKCGTYSNCPTCNPEGENDEGPEGCPGDEEFPDCECYDGYINYYWD